jgi:hypothetical protein
MGNLILHYWPIFHYHHQLVQIVNSYPIVLEACLHSSYSKNSLQESPEFVEPQKKHLETMFHELSPNQMQYKIFLHHMWMAE